MKAMFKLSALVCCAALFAPLSAIAAPHFHTVCHVEKHNHHPVRVCHRVR